MMEVTPGGVPVELLEGVEPIGTTPEGDVLVFIDDDPTQLFAFDPATQEVRAETPAIDEIGRHKLTYDTMQPVSYAVDGRTSMFAARNNVHRYVRGTDTLVKLADGASPRFVPCPPFFGASSTSFALDDIACILQMVPRIDRWYIRGVGLNSEQRADWVERGYFIVRRFAAPARVEAMIERVAQLARREAGGEERPDLHIAKEGVLTDPATPEEGVAKIFRVMRTEDVFREFATDPRLLELLGDLLGADVDCFLSQFIFKHPGALGQPWHQDDYYFRMTPLPQVGVWLACTAATPDNGPLWVVPGSHREDIHDVVPDTRAGAGLGYVEIVAASVEDEAVVLMEPGDMLVFHSHLRHKSTDNNSTEKRAAMVYHYAVADTVGHRAFNQDWTEVLRDGRPVEASTEPVPIDH